MNVLVDHHHGALLRSMYYLFKKRLRFNLYVPIGFEWLDEDKLYSCYPHRKTADQMLNSWTYDLKYKNMFEPMSLEKFKDIDVDIVVASLWENHSIFDNIIKKYNKKSKLILQVGNNIPIPLIYMCGTRNLLSSSYPVFYKSNVSNKIFYHQEFNTDFFKPTKCQNNNSVINLKHIVEEEMNLFSFLENKLGNWNFKCFGINNRDGIIEDIEKTMSDKINDFGFVFHIKKDDGYGHVIHNAFACGKPMLISLNMARVLWDGEFIRNTASFLYNDDTVINVDDTFDNILHKLIKFSENYEHHSDLVYKKFKEIVNFDEEESKIRIFLENLT